MPRKTNEQKRRGAGLKVLGVYLKTRNQRRERIDWGYAVALYVAGYGIQMAMEPGTQRRIKRFFGLS